MVVRPDQLVHPLVAGLLEAIVDGVAANLRAREQAIEGELRDNDAPAAVTKLARQVHQLAYYFEVEIEDAAAARRVFALLHRMWPHVYPKITAGVGVDARMQAALRKQHAAKLSSASAVSDVLRPAGGQAVGLRRRAPLGVTRGKA